MPPSSDPVKWRILDEIRTTLRGIDGGSDYFFNIVDDYVTIADPGAAIELPGFPYVAISDLGTTYENPRARVVRSISGAMQVVISVYHCDSSDLAQSLEQLIHDVHKALYVDRTRSGLAIFTIVTADNISLVSDDEEPIGVVDITVEIDYRTLVTDPTTTQT